MRNGVLFVISLVLLALGLVAYFASQQAPLVPVMDTPAIQRQLAEAKAQGQAVLVSFWATWCPPCRIEFPQLVRLRQAVPESRLRILGLAMEDEPKAVVAYAQEQRAGFPVYMVAPEVKKRFGVVQIPHLFLYDRNGVQVLNQLGLMEPGELEKAVARAVGQ